jgi:hypothetical protein
MGSHLLNDVGYGKYYVILSVLDIANVRNGQGEQQSCVSDELPSER